MSEKNTVQTATRNTERSPPRPSRISPSRAPITARRSPNKSQAAAETAGKSFQKSHETASSDAADFGAQWIEMVRANTNASLDFAHQLITAKSPTEAFELSAADTRRQLQTFLQQSQQLTELAQKTASGAVKPMQDGMRKRSTRPPEPVPAELNSQRPAPPLTGEAFFLRTRL